jgi:predicted amidohydrolase YtcJ
VAARSYTFTTLPRYVYLQLTCMHERLQILTSYQNDEGYPHHAATEHPVADLVSPGGYTYETLLGPEDVFPQESIRIYVAKKIITVNDNQPEAEAVAVTSDGLIGQVGTLKECLDWAGTRTPDKSKIEVDDRSVADKILVPGFIESHGHNMEGVNLLTVFVGFFPTPALDGEPRKCSKSFDDLIQILKEEDAAMNARGADPTEPLLAVGFDPIYFEGQRLDKNVLDKACPTRPVFMRHASGHLATVNSAMLKLHNIVADPKNQGVICYPGTDEPNGELAEPPGMFLAKSAVAKFMAMATSTNALNWYSILARNAGHTTSTELASPFLAKPDSYEAWRQVVSDDRFPIRLVTYPLVAFGATGDKDFTPAAEQLKTWQENNNDKFVLGGAKLLFDGSIQGFTACLREPRYYKPPSGDPKHQGMLTALCLTM